MAVPDFYKLLFYCFRIHIHRSHFVFLKQEKRINDIYLNHPRRDVGKDKSWSKIKKYRGNTPE